MLLRYILLSLSFIALANSYLIGTGKADITGSIAQVMLMGYAVIGQTGEGLLQRLYARAFIIEENGSRIVFVNTDTQSMGDIIKTFVIDELKTKYGTLYTEKNIMISSTHSHSGMGGYLQHSMYLIE
jgi:neutral ceramidase